MYWLTDCHRLISACWVILGNILYMQGYARKWTTKSNSHSCGQSGLLVKCSQEDFKCVSFFFCQMCLWTWKNDLRTWKYKLLGIYTQDCHPHKQTAKPQPKNEPPLLCINSSVESFNEEFFTKSKLHDHFVDFIFFQKGVLKLQNQILKKKRNFNVKYLINCNSYGADLISLRPCFSVTCFSWQCSLLMARKRLGADQWLCVITSAVRSTQFLDMRVRPSRLLRSLFLVVLILFVMLNMHVLLNFNSHHPASIDPLLYKLRNPDIFINPHVQVGHEKLDSFTPQSNEAKLEVFIPPLMYNQTFSKGDVQENNLTQIKLEIDRVNREQFIHNLHKFGLKLKTDSVVMVIQVHDRAQYLQILVDSLRKVKKIEETLVIFSHDVYSEALNKIVQSIDFCPVSIWPNFFFQIQWHCKSFFFFLCCG